MFSDRRATSLKTYMSEITASFAQDLGLYFAIPYQQALAMLIERIQRLLTNKDWTQEEAARLCGQASLRMEQTLWPEDYERMTREIEAAPREADDPNARSYTHEEVMQAMEERIDRVRNTSC